VENQAALGAKGSGHRQFRAIAFHRPADNFIWLGRFQTLTCLGQFRQEFRRGIFRGGWLISDWHCGARLVETVEGFSRIEPGGLLTPLNSRGRANGSRGIVPCRRGSVNRSSTGSENPSRFSPEPQRAAGAGTARTLKEFSRFSVDRGLSVAVAAGTTTVSG